MSFFDDLAESVGVGPQTDGTNLPSDISIMPQPTDAAGGAPAQYSSGILDLFKYGIGAYAQNQQTQQLFDYKRFEATSGGLYRQGTTAAMPAAPTGGMGGLAMVGIAAVILFAVLTHKA